MLAFGNCERLFDNSLRQKSRQQCNQNLRAQRQQSDQGASGERIVENNHDFCPGNNLADMIRTRSAGTSPWHHE